MNNIELTSLIIPSIAGAVLCLVYLAMIKQTLKKMQMSISTARTMFLGAAIRLIVVGLTFYYFASDGKHWSQLTACLVGFVIVRMVMLSRVVDSVDFKDDNKTEDN